MNFSRQLVDTVSSFSFRTVLRTNIISTPGSSFGKATALSNPSNGLVNTSPMDTQANARLMSSYYLKLQELTGYKYNELTETVLRIYKDYLAGYFNSDSDIILLKDDVEDKEIRQARINKIYRQLDLVQALKDNLDGFIYDGNYSFKLVWNEEDRIYERLNLINPNSVIKISRGKQIPEGYLAVSRDGVIYEVSPYSILNFSNSELDLVNDIKPDYFDSDEDTLVSDIQLAAGCPMYYYNSSKVKEYLIKDQLVSLLSIKDLIQPLLLLLRVDNNTAPDEANKLALNVENLINKYADISSLMSSNFTISDLIDSLLNNIRVIPDYQSGMGDMNNIDLSKITNKIQEIRSDQDGLKESILNGLAIPRALYSGDSTKWDAIKGSQRLNSRVNSIIKALVDSVVRETIKIDYMTSGKLLRVNDITCNLFMKTEVDYNNELTNAEIVNNIVDQINRIIDQTQRTAKDSEIIDPKEFINYVKLKLIMIDPDIVKFMDDSTIEKYIKSIMDQRNSQSEGGGFGGRF